jgi:hypothetical protein
MSAERSSRAAGRQRRFRRSAVAALIALAVVVFVSEMLRPADTPDPSGPGREQAMATVSMEDSTSAWFCAGGTSQRGGSADETVVIANVAPRGGARAQVRISVLTGTDPQGEPIAPAVRDLSLAPAAQVSVPVAELVASADPGVIVEGRGAPIVVTHVLRGNGDSAVASCARGGSDRWYFGGGTTVLGANLTLWLFNPFAGDAVVDLSFSTDGGNEAPNEFQGLVVPGRTRLAVPIESAVRRRTAVATQVTARRGRVIAEQSQALDGRDGRKGLTLVVGQPAPSTGARYDAGIARPDRATTLSVANPGDVAVEVRIDTALAGVVTVEPQVVEVPPRGVAVVDVGARVPVDTAYAVTTTVLSGPRSSRLGVVGYLETAFKGTAALAADAGATVASDRWFVVPGRVGTNPVDAVTVHAPTFAVRWHIDAIGTTTRRIASGRLARNGVIRVPTDAAGPIVVTADGPIVVGRDSGASPGVTSAAAVPQCPARDGTRC